MPTTAAVQPGILPVLNFHIYLRIFFAINLIITSSHLNACNSHYSLDSGVLSPMIARVVSWNKQMLQNYLSDKRHSVNSVFHNSKDLVIGLNLMGCGRSVRNA